MTDTMLCAKADRAAMNDAAELARANSAAKTKAQSATTSAPKDEYVAPAQSAPKQGEKAAPQKESVVKRFFNWIESAFSSNGQVGSPKAVVAQANRQQAVKPQTGDCTLEARTTSGMRCF